MKLLCTIKSGELSPLYSIESGKVYNVFELKDSDCVRNDIMFRLNLDKFYLVFDDNDVVGIYSRDYFESIQDRRKRVLKSIGI